MTPYDPSAAVVEFEKLSNWLRAALVEAHAAGVREIHEALSDNADDFHEASGDPAGDLYRSHTLSGVLQSLATVKSIARRHGIDL